MTFLEFNTCAGCGEPFPIRSINARKAKWCSDRCRKQTLYSTPCVDCGTPTTGDGERHERCQACDRRMIGRRQRDHWASHQRQVEELWAKGLTGREIASVMGWKAKNPTQVIVNLRRRGYDLPHRRTPEQLVRMGVGANERMAKARAARASQRASAGSDTRKRAALSFSAWDHAKRQHKKLLLHLLRMPCHVVLCLRAQDKISLVKENGQLKAVPKQSLTGLDGWEPICERRLPYEMTCSFLLLPDRPGVPRPLKPMPPTMATLIPLNQPITEKTGAALAQWAAGDSIKPSGEDKQIGDLVAQLLALSDKLGKRDVVTEAIAENRHLHAGEPAEHAAWLEKQCGRLKEAAAKQADKEIPV